MPLCPCWPRAPPPPEDEPLIADPPGGEGTCRICLDRVGPPVEAPGGPRMAFTLAPHTRVDLCDCTRMPYHIGCLAEQLEAWSSREGWDRCCDVCRQPWAFMPRQDAGVAPHRWTRWDAAEGAFAVEGAEGVWLRVGPGTGSTPAGPAIPLADAYTTVQAEFPDGVPPALAGYAVDGRAMYVPWVSLHSVFGGR